MSLRGLRTIKLWESVDKLLGRGRTGVCPSLGMESLNDFFVEKVSKVRDTTFGASKPTFSLVRDNVSLSALLRHQL